jgi:DHA1 family multidrug resistance protein-like MFS transporter
MSLLWLGWTKYPSISIWSGLTACFLFGIILTAIYVSSYKYIIDSYGEHAAMALTSITMVRFQVYGSSLRKSSPFAVGDDD